MKPKYFFISALVFLADRLAKEMVIRQIPLGDIIPALPFFNWTYVQNTGVAFGLGQNFNFIFILVSFILIGLLAGFYRKLISDQNAWANTGLALVMGGAIGNLYDRIVFKSVVDFLDFFVGAHHWPAFNIADACICTGVALLLFSQKKMEEVNS